MLLLLLLFTASYRNGPDCKQKPFLYFFFFLESQEKEDCQREARRPGSGHELSDGGAAGGRAATEAGWNESGVGGGAGG